MSSRRTNDLEALSERLGSLQIMNEASNKTSERMDTEMSTEPAPMAVEISKNVTAGMPKNIVPDPGWFDGDRTKFEDWWRGIQLFLKSNRVIETDDRITAILARLRGGVAGIYTQKKLDELDEELGTQDWEDFVKEIKTTFSDKSKAADAEYKIETFKQGKKNTADFMIEFEALAMKADTDELHAIFLLKKNVRHDIIKMILGYPPIAMSKILKEWKVAITSVGQGYESTEGRHNYKTSTGITYGGRGQPMNIGKSNDNFKDGKPKCFNCNKYGHMAKECQSEKKERETRMYFKCDKKGHIAKDCKGKQIMKKRKVQKESDNEDNKEEEKGFGKDLE